MGHCVRIILPDFEDAMAPIIGRIVGRWGGCTLSDGVGFWSDKNGRIVRDRITIVECNIGPWDSESREWWTDLSDSVRKQWSQDAVFLSVHKSEGLIIGPEIVEAIGG